MTTPLTWPATANVIVQTGAKPVFGDVDPVTLCLDPGEVAAAVTPRTRAIMPVHYAGHPADLAALHEICEEHGLRLIEDAAHAVVDAAPGRAQDRLRSATRPASGSTPTRTSPRARAGCSPSATSSSRRASPRCGCTGSLATRGSATRRRARAPTTSLEPGYKYNLCDLHAGVALGQLHRIDAHHARRAAQTARYDEGLAGPAGISPIGRRLGTGGAHGCHLYVVRIDAEPPAPTATPTRRRWARRRSARDCTSSPCTSSPGSGLHPTLRLPHAELAARRCCRCRSRPRTRSTTSTTSSRPCAACTRTSRDDPQSTGSGEIGACADRAPDRALGRADRRDPLAGRPAPHRHALRDTSPGWFGAAIAINLVATGVMARAGTCCSRTRPARAGLGWLFETYTSRCCSARSCPRPSAATPCGRSTSRAAPARVPRRSRRCVVDRIVGLAALGALAAGGAARGGHGHRRGMAVALGLGVMAVTALAAVALFSLRLRAAAAPAARRSRARSASRAPLRALYDALHAYRGHPGALAWVFVLGVRRAAPARHLVGVPRAGHGPRLGFATLLVLCPVLFLVTSCPISLNGVGLREATFVVVLRERGVAREDAFVLGLAFFAVGVLTARWAVVLVRRRSLAGRRGGSRAE